MAAAGRGDAAGRKRHRTRIAMAVAALDGTVELRSLRRQHVEGETFRPSCLLEVGHKLEADVDLDALDQGSGPYRHFLLTNLCDSPI
jgi:hypothetical protein